MKTFYTGTIIAMLFLISGCSVGPLISEGEIFKNLVQVTEGEGDNYDPVISPDGKMILFVSERDGNPNIYLRTNILAKGDIKRTEHKASEIHPSFSSDGKKFCFASDINGNYDIFIMDTEVGYAKTQATTNSDDEIFPNWSPTEDLILYSQYSKQDRNWYIWSKNLVNGQITQICKGLLAKFTSDGKSFYYKKADKNNYYQLWKIGLDGNTDTQLTFGDEWGVGTYALQPNGKKIIFATYKSKGYNQEVTKDGYDLWVLNLENGDLIQVTTHKGSDFSPAWTSDNMIYFASNRMKDINIWSFKAPF